ncbi:MAG: autotransporter-associated beta strand repeat-containing protein [Planctomycetaceae bacterium]|jgi:autotransporter-associated beta strand protein/predicted outer membrane repeat protein|nr:autotransporter-associated beta strand repeat-containing protein [Planctomycetaceae bacterium]
MLRRSFVLSLCFALSLVLFAQTVSAQNRVVQWTGDNGNNAWNITSQNWRYDSPPLPTAFSLDDAAVFDDYSPGSKTISVQSGGVRISQRSGWLTDPATGAPNFVQEYGMHITGQNDWTFNGGAISDNFAANVRTVVGRVVFDGTGTLTLNNGAANIFHDGFVAGNTAVDGTGVKLPPGIVNAVRLDVLGSGEFAGEQANVYTADPYAPQLRPYIVQKEGYGVMFTGNGAEIKVTNANSDPNYMFDNRIHVGAGSTGSIVLPQSNTETVVKVSEFYWKNNANFGIYDEYTGQLITSTPIQRGGVIVAEDNSTFTMTGNFHFKDNRILKSIDDQLNPNTANMTYSVTDTGVDADTFYGGVLYAGKSVNVDMTGASFTNNGKLAVKTVNAGGSVDYTFLPDTVDPEQIVTVAAGGAIYFTGGEIITPVDDDPLTEEIEQDIITYSGLTVSASSSSARTTFADNAAQTGGAVYIADGTGSTFNAEDVDFTKNRAYKGSGGAVFIQNSRKSIEKMQVKLAGSAFINNVAFGSADSPAVGGALVILADADVDLTGTAFRYNGVTVNELDGNVDDYVADTKTFLGGAIAAGENVHLISAGQSAQFEGNAALSDGGAIYIGGGNTQASRSSIDLAGAGFVNNHSINGSGGAIYSINTDVSVSESGFTGNDALLNGGAIYLEQSGVTLTITNATFSDNAVHSADSRGGAIYAGGDNITVAGTGSKFSYNMYGNPANRDNDHTTPNPDLGKGLQGGAIYIGNYAKLYLSGAYFNANRTTAKRNDSQGGAVYTGIGADIDLTGAIFENNYAYSGGGAVYTVGGEQNGEIGTLLLENARFLKNGISPETGGRNTQYGGAVYTGLTVVNGDRATFSENEAYSGGGAVYVEKVNQETAILELNDTQFDRNKATNGSGGAIYLNAAGGTDYNLVLNADGSQFLSNTAQRDGGAIYGTARTVINVNSSENGNAVFGSYNSQTGNTAGRHGGAIYLNGNEGDKKAASQLNAQEAVFEYNTAGANGGAVYLYYADADITGAQFLLNSAKGLGGGLYFENENGKELTLETAAFTGNKAVSGGAVHTVNETVILAQNAVFERNEATAGTGGAINFAANNSQIDVSMAKFIDNTASGDGGAVRLNKNSKIIATHTSFYNNTSTTGGGAAIKIGDNGQIHGYGSQFDNNTANGPGGAIWLDGTASGVNIVNVDNSRFTGNQSLTNSGGAIYAGYADITAANAVFADNTAAVNGGGIGALNSTALNLTGASFTNNTATGKGGAVYFQTTDSTEGVDRVINLGASAGQNSVFSGNTANGEANSIYFDSSKQGTVRLEVSTATNGTLKMLDPMTVDETNNLIYLEMVKSGTGKWTLGGVNNLDKTSVGTTLEIVEGNFELASGAELNLRNTDKGDKVVIRTGAGFGTAGSKDETAAVVRTTNFDAAVNSKMQLDGNLTLTVANDYTIGSVIGGNGGLIKEDFKNPDGSYSKTTLTFRGATEKFNGDVVIRSGDLVIVKDARVAGSGRIVTENGTFYAAPDTDLYLNADRNNPTIVVKSANINNSNIHVGGITSNYGEEFILIHTTDGIIGDFKTASGDTKELQLVDYLMYNLGFLNDHKDYGGNIGLRWYSNDDVSKAWGNFTLTDKNDYFNVGVVLNDNNKNLDSSWNGTTLDKYGLGTLELSQTNTYTGKTTIHAGELYLTNSQGTGLGNAVVEVKKDATLGLNFNGNYAKNIIGGGQVTVKNGNVELSGENTYGGGTVLKDGVLSFHTPENLGTGTLTFDGGTLKNLQTATLNLPVAVNKNQDAVFDVPQYGGTDVSLTVDGVISGDGGLKKRGKGTLALTADNTYKGLSHVEQGGLQITGSVAGDVRVYLDAAVSGNNGYIGGNLYINKGGFYDWYFTPDRAASGPLNVAGNVYIDDVVFRPRTHSADFTDHIEGWTVLTYGGNLNREFAAVDNSFNAFYDFTLDYSINGEVRINGDLLSKPKPMSDIVATGLSIANRKLYRNVFAQLSRETVFCKTAGSSERDAANPAVRGQTQQNSRSAWFTPMARANNFASTWVGGDYSFETYGMQTGTTFWENRHGSLGLMLGYERGMLRNSLDWIRSHDYYLGLYYGYLSSEGYELRSFLGGGIQTFTLARNDLQYIHKATYDGTSFEWNTEFGKWFAGQNGTIFRPYIAGDLETSSISTAQEKQIDDNDIVYRHYGRATLPQFFVRFGADAEKRYQYVDINGGISYTGLLFGKTYAKAPVYYPVRGAGSTSHSARLGRSSITFKTGLNWHLNRQRTSSVFLDYFADVYMDRAGDTAQHTGNVGMSVRF